MSVEEKDLVDSLRLEDSNFSRLYEEHAQLDRQVRELESKRYLTGDLEFEVKRLKKLKLRAKDAMAEILKRHRASQPG